MTLEKCVIVLAGTKWQIPLVKRLKKEGYRVVVFNSIEDSPAFKLADDYRIVDILNREECLKLAKEFQPIAVMSEECDIAVTMVAWLSEQMGLKGIGSEHAYLYTDKSQMRELGNKKGFPTPKSFKCHSVNEACETFKKFGKKMILKPLDANSSRGVFTVNTQEDIIQRYDDCVLFSKTEQSVLLEEYIDGVEFTIDGIKTDVGHFSLAISEKEHYAHNENIACSLFFSHSNDKYDYEELRRVNDMYVMESGLPFGLTHAEYKCRDGQFYLIEIGARGGGNLISALIVPNMSGVDNYKYLIEKTLDIDTNERFEIAESLKKRCAVLKFIDLKTTYGVVKEIKGCDFLNTCEKVLDYNINVCVGDELAPVTDDSKRIGYYIAYAEGREELLKLMTRIESKVEIVVE